MRFTIETLSIKLQNIKGFYSYVTFYSVNAHFLDYQQSITCLLLNPLLRFLWLIKYFKLRYVSPAKKITVFMLQNSTKAVLLLYQDIVF